MAGSQKSFEARGERFSQGVVLINGWLDYDPNNTKIKKIALASIVSTVNARNAAVNSTLLALATAQGARAPLVFTLKDTNPLCLQKRIEMIVSYLSGDFGKMHAATKLVRRVRDKMHPHYPKKPVTDPPQPRGAGKSPMEKSFASAVGQGQDVIDCIISLGVAYKPADINLKVPAMQALVDAIKAANTAVTQALEAYGTANRNRKDIYDGTDGMADLITNIKGYLVSFSGGKKSNHYTEFLQAISGT
jgi:hypothetical protein